MAASFHPSHRVQETEREVTSRFRTGRPRRAGDHSMATTTATATQHQRTVRMVWTPPPVAGVEATLVAARWLPNNPPLAHASPSVVEQWHHDVDQLIIAAINTSHHERGWQEPAAMHSCSPLAVRASPSARGPHQAHVLPRIAMTDLRDELIHHRRCENEKMLEKLTMHDIQDVTELFSQAHKYASAAEGRA
jgi:hypothetical protein